MGAGVGGKLKSQGMYVQSQLIRVAVELQITQRCKAIILQLKKKYRIFMHLYGLQEPGVGRAGLSPGHVDGRLLPEASTCLFLRVSVSSPLIRTPGLWGQDPPL